MVYVIKFWKWLDLITFDQQCFLIIIISELYLFIYGLCNQVLEMTWPNNIWPTMLFDYLEFSYLCTSKWCKGAFYLLIRSSHLFWFFGHQGYPAVRVDPTILRCSQPRPTTLEYLTMQESQHREWLLPNCMVDSWGLYLRSVNASIPGTNFGQPIGQKELLVIYPQ